MRTRHGRCGMRLRRTKRLAETFFYETLTMKRQDFRFVQPLRPLAAGQAAQGDAFETAVGAYWRALGLAPELAAASLHGEWRLVAGDSGIALPAAGDEPIDGAVRCTAVDESVIRFCCAAFRGEQVLASGELRYGWAESGSGVPRPVPPAVRALLQDFEAGQPVVELVTGSWQDLGADAAPVRTAVFIDEQAIPAEMEWDEADRTALHAVVRNRLGRPLATGRLLIDAPGVARIGRMAVLRAVRGTNLGRDVVNALMAAAWARGDHTVILSAQRSAVGFYARLGFEERGAEYEDAGIPHVDMVRQR